MKKALLLIATLMLALSCVFACSKKPEAHKHTLTHHDAVAATCISTGSVAYDECSGCHKKFDAAGKEITDVVLPIDSAAHTNLVDHTAQPATCMAEGTIYYKECDGCHKKYDAEGNEVTNIVDPVNPTAHRHLTEHAEVKATCIAEGSVYYKECDDCHKKYDKNGDLITDVVIAIDKNAHSLSDVAAKAATCEATGNVAHKHCSLCEKNFADDGVTEIADVTTDKDPTNHVGLGDLIGATTHTCIADGTVAHYHCAGCGKDVAEDGKTVLDSIVNAEDAAQHDFVDDACSRCHLAASYSIVSMNTSTATTSGSKVLAFDKKGIAQDTNGALKSGTTGDPDYGGEHDRYRNVYITVTFIDYATGKINIHIEFEEDTANYNWAWDAEWTKKSGDYVGYLDKVNGYIIVNEGLKNGKSDAGVDSSKTNLVFVPSTSALSSGKLVSVNVGTYGVNYSSVKPYSHDGHNFVVINKEVYFNVTFEKYATMDADAETATAADFGSNVEIFYIKDASGNILGRYGKSGNSIVELDGNEGAYTIGDYSFTLNGVDKIVMNGKTGSYAEIEDGKYSATFEDAYYEFTLGDSATFVKPMVTVTYVSDKGLTEADKTASVNKNIAYETKVLSDDKYTFIGWTYVGDDGKTVTLQPGEKLIAVKDVTLTAVWAKNITINVTDETGRKTLTGIKAHIGQSWNDVLEDAFGSSVVVDGVTYVVKGFYYNDKLIDGDILAEDFEDIDAITLAVKWKENYKLTIKYGKGLDDYEKTYPEDSTVELIDPGYTTYEGKGYVITGWTKDGETYVADKITSDIEVVAVWTETVLPFASGKVVGISLGSLESSSGGYGCYKYAFSKELTFDSVAGTVTGWGASVKPSDVTYDSATGTIAFGTSNSDKGYYNAEYGVMLVNKSYIYVVGATSVSVTKLGSSKMNAIAANNQAFIVAQLNYTKNGKDYTVMITALNNELYVGAKVMIKQGSISAQYEDLSDDMSVLSSYSAWEYKNVGIKLLDSKDNEIIAYVSDASASSLYYVKVAPKMVKLTVNVNVDGDKSTEYEVEVGAELDMDQYIPSITGYDFVGWYLDAEFATEFTATSISADTSVYAKMEARKPDEVNYKLFTGENYSFTVAGGVFTGAPNKLGATSTMSMYAIKDIAVSFDYAVTSKSFASTFTVKNGNTGVVTETKTASNSVSVTVKAGTLLQISMFVLNDDSEDGDVTANVVISNLKVDGIAVTAFEDKAKLTVWNGEVSSEYEITSGTTITLSDYVPTVEGYNFVGWYSDKDFTTQITNSTITVYADTEIFAKFAEAVTENKFRGLKFTGTFYDSWYEQITSIRIEFADTDEISGCIYSGSGTSYYFNFTAVLDGNEIVFTFTSAVDSGAIGKTMKGTISGSKITFVKGTYSSGTYAFWTQGSVSCDGFSL